jgi:hypothetical protein
VFAADLGGTLYAFDAANGAVRWQTATGQSMGGGIVSYLAGGKQRLGVAAGMKSPIWPGGSAASQILVYGRPTVAARAFAPNGLCLFGAVCVPALPLGLASDPSGELCCVRPISPSPSFSRSLPSVGLHAQSQNGSAQPAASAARQARLKVRSTVRRLRWLESHAPPPFRATKVDDVHPHAERGWRSVARQGARRIRTHDRARRGATEPGTRGRWRTWRRRRSRQRSVVFR